ncbi:toprim domain-containing protein [Abyssicoccus albus]|uniref:DNA primase n=1 Tax=Abyssicoccus albus TaxID=1817405 RepID=A0A3N5BHM3_9BACL|nr:toprim domain-containing protein [Abyssicoccus albus]RPF54780.1 DNA primase [Abyssicoccus albus]
MANIKVGDRHIDVDLMAELEPYEFHRQKRSGDKLIACSPFRDDDTPSFFINAGDSEYAGTWGDSGAYDDYWKSGNFVQLLAYLRSETYEETVDYLRSIYDYEYVDTDIHIEFKPLYERKGFVEVPKDKYEDKSIDYAYLKSRGINPKVIEKNGIFDNGSSIGIPWHDINGRVANIKYRSKYDKVFWYENEATPINRLVYGIHHVVQNGIKRIVVCEAEIDAMTWQSSGTMAVAVGGSAFNRIQADLIVASGVEEVILGGDFDAKGRLLNERVYELLRNKVNDIYRVQITEEMSRLKDANNLGIIRLSELNFERVNNLPTITI